MANNFPKLHLDVVELDEAVLRVAKECFDFKESERVRVIVGDGIEFVKKFKKGTGPCVNIVCAFLYFSRCMLNSVRE